MCQLVLSDVQIFSYLRIKLHALPGVAQLDEYRPMNQKVTGLRSGNMPGLQGQHIQRATD